MIKWQKPQQGVLTSRTSTCGKYCIVRQSVIKNGKQAFEYHPMVKAGNRWRDVGFNSFEEAAGFLE